MTLARQHAILDRLAAGPNSLAALIASIEPSDPAAIMRAVKQLEVSGKVTVTGRKSRQVVAGAVVTLVEQPIRREAEARRPGGTVLEAFNAWSAFLR